MSKYFNIILQSTTRSSMVFFLYVSPPKFYVHFFVRPIDQSPILPFPLLTFFQITCPSTNTKALSNFSQHNLGLISNLMHKILVYLHIIHLLNTSTCFEHYPAHLHKVYVVIVYMQPLVSTLYAGTCLVHRLRKNATC